MVISAFFLGLLLGAGLLFWRNVSFTRRTRRIPRQWPLKLRPFVNNREKRVWVWLSRVMFDHQVLVKLPVTRFTSPANQADADHWYELLNGIYCTFTVCDVEGNVIGCVDVPGPKGISLSNQTLKHTLLMQCGLHYWVVDPASLPQLAVIRTAFLGEEAMKSSHLANFKNRFNHVRDHLEAEALRQRDSKDSNFARLDAQLSNGSEFAESRMSSGWEQNSFVTPLDSRRDHF